MWRSESEASVGSYSTVAVEKPSRFVDLLKTSCTGIKSREKLISINASGPRRSILGLLGGMAFTQTVTLHDTNQLALMTLQYKPNDHIRLQIEEPKG